MRKILAVILFLTANLYGQIVNPPVFPAAPNFTTNSNSIDASTQAATDAFTQNAIDRSMSTSPLAITGGTYSFDSLGTGSLMNYTASGGAITSITLFIPFVGSGYAAGDVITPAGGNYDAMVVITAVTGGVPSAGAILYGGTGYTSGTSAAQGATLSAPFTWLLSGTLTSNATIIATYGSYITESNQYLFANNTTGAFTVTVCQGGATDACAGGGTTVGLPQGTANATSLFVSVDGVLNAWIADNGLLLAGLPASFSVAKVAIVAVGSLPACNAGADGTHSGVNNALAPVSLAIVAGGGSAHVPVYCNGTNWIVE